MNSLLDGVQISGSSGGGAPAPSSGLFSGVDIGETGLSSSPSNTPPVSLPDVDTGPKSKITFGDIFPNFKNGGDLTGVASSLGKLIEPPSQDAVGGMNSQTDRVLAYLPSEIARHLPFVGSIVKMLQDDPDSSDVSLGDVGTGTKETAQSILHQVASYPLTFYGATSALLHKHGLENAPGTDSDGNFNFDIPGLGSFTNIQARIAQDYKQNPVPSTAFSTAIDVAKYTGEEFLNGLFTAGLLSSALNPRTVAVTKTGKINVPEGMVQNGLPPRSFRSYEPAFYKSPVAPEVFEKIVAENNISVKAAYDPDMPTFFEFKGTSPTSAAGRFVQVKPSYLEAFFKQFGGDVSKIPSTNLITVAETQKSIEAPEAQEVVKNDGTEVDVAAKELELPQNELGALSDEKLNEHVKSAVAAFQGSEVGAQKQTEVKETPPPAKVPEKSAAEKPLYHGTTIENAEIIGREGFKTGERGKYSSPGLSLTTDQDTAKAFSAKFPVENRTILNVSIDPKANIAKLADMMKLVGDDFESKSSAEDAAIKLAYEQKYDAIDLTDAKSTLYRGHNEIRVFNKDMLSIGSDNKGLTPTEISEAKKHGIDISNTSPESVAQAREMIAAARAEKVKMTVSDPKKVKTGETPYHINNMDRKFIPVKGVKVEVTPDAEMFAYKYQPNLWRISEARTGMLVAEGKTKTEAIENAKEKIKEGIAKSGGKTLQQIIQGREDENGLSPRFAEKEKAIETAKKMVKETAPHNEIVGTLIRKHGLLEKEAQDITTEAMKAGTQKETVKKSVKNQPKSIKQVAEETGIKEPNIRRILGVGTKEGVFERVEEGVYILNNGKEDIAYVHTADAAEALPRLVAKGTKVDMVFLDIPYNTAAVKGGNRGVNYSLISVDDFRKVMVAISKLVRNDDSPVYYMYSNAQSGLEQMMKYNNVLTETGFKAVAAGSFQKLFKTGKPVTNVRGEVARPEGILLLNRTGEFVEKDAERNLDFRLVRPHGYQTEKPANLLRDLILQGTKAGETVLDPFAGSGVTGAEAVKTGRKAILIEKNAEVAENITKPRVKAAVREYTNEFGEKISRSEIDEDIRPLIDAMNDAGIRTVESGASHVGDTEIPYISINPADISQAQKMLDEVNKESNLKWIFDPHIPHIISPKGQSLTDLERPTQTESGLMKVKEDFNRMISVLNDMYEAKLLKNAPAGNASMPINKKIAEEINSKIDEYSGLPVGKHIGNPDARIPVGAGNRYITNRALKHFVESRMRQGMNAGDIKKLAMSAHEVSDDPESNIPNPNQKANPSSRLLGRRINNSEEGVQIVVAKDGEKIVGIFRNEHYGRDLIRIQSLASGRAASDLKDQSSIDKLFKEGPSAASRLPDFQKQDTGLESKESIQNAAKKVNKIMPGLEKLSEMARKYDTVEDFIDNLGTSYFLHGSPEVFDKYDLSKMGTNEGMAAWGKGMYVATDYETVKRYAKLSQKEATPKIYLVPKKGLNIVTPEYTDTVDLWSKIADVLEKKFNYPKVAEKIRQSIKNGDPERNPQFWHEDFDIMLNWDGLDIYDKVMKSLGIDGVGDLTPEMSELTPNLDIAQNTGLVLFEPDTLKVHRFTEKELTDFYYESRNAQAQFDNSIQLNAEIIPGLAKTITEDLMPGAKNTVGNIRMALKEIATWFNPAGQAPQAAVDIMMKHKGDFERYIFRMEQAVKKIKIMWDKQPEAARLDFMAKRETSETVADPKLQALADLYSERLAAAHKEISQYKDISFIENFFPHFWKDPEKIEKKFIPGMISRRPLQGPKTFLKHRVFASIQEGIKAGYVPVTSNPEELMQIYETNVKKFVMAQKIKDDMTKKGLWHFVRMGEKPPGNFVKINDAIAQIYFKSNRTVTEYFDEQLMEGLNKLAKDLGVKHERKLSFGHRGRRNAAGLSFSDKQEVWTKFGSPESVFMHELGHQIDNKYGLKEKLVNNKEYKDELRKLADARLGERTPEEIEAFLGSTFHSYIRKGEEKMAVMFESYLHAPEIFRKLAPKTYQWFLGFMGSHPELRPILELKPSLALSMNKMTEEGPMIKTGEYYAEKGAARLVNNYLSRDLIYETAIGTGMMNVKNTMNAFQLGFSAFHLTMETLDTIVTKFSVGLSRISTGNFFTGLVDISKAPIAPYSFFRDGQKFFNNDPMLKDIEESLFTGGASLKSRQYYKSTVLDTFMKNVRGGNYLGAMLRTPLAAVEATMRPLFNYYIPRLKVGAFRDLYAQQLQQFSKKIRSGEMTQAQVARMAWNNIENRMGEINYDNLFWNRTFKTSMMLAFRSVGWNLGTIRELGGAIFQDLPKEGFKAGKGHGFTFTAKISYAISLFFVTGMIGAIYQYLHTGKGPERIKDLFYPANGAKTAAGDDQRVEFPTYLKDLWQYGNQPIQTVANKFAPEFTALIDLLRNQDFYGDNIRNENDNLPTQMKQVAVFLAKQFVPFSVANVNQQLKGQSTSEQHIESFLGIVNAPKKAIETEWQKGLSQIYTEQVGASGPRTPQEVEIDKAKAKAREEIKSGDYTTLKELLRQGVIKPAGVKKFIENSKLNTNQRMYQGLSKENKAKFNELYGDQLKYPSAPAPADGSLKPQFDDGQRTTKQGVIDTIWTYAKAVGSDPSAAFHDIFAGQRIVAVTNGAVIVQRMPLSESESVKKELGGTKDMELDHWIPLSLGGTNEKSNLRLISIEKAKAADKLEASLAADLKAGKISKKDAIKKILDFKNSL